MLLWGSKRVVSPVPSFAGAPEGWTGLPLALPPAPSQGLSLGIVLG